MCIKNRHRWVISSFSGGECRVPPKQSAKDEALERRRWVFSGESRLVSEAVGIIDLDANRLSVLFGFANIHMSNGGGSKLKQSQEKQEEVSTNGETMLSEFLGRFRIRCRGIVLHLSLAQLSASKLFSLVEKLLERFSLLSFNLWVLLDLTRPS